MFESIKSVLYITRNQIEYWGEHEYFSKLDIPVTVIDNLEIYDQKNFEQIVGEWLDSMSLSKHKLLLIVGEDLVFSLSIPLQDTQYAEKIKDFHSTIPFDEKNIVTCIAKTKTEQNIYATNYSIIHTIVQVCFQKGIEVVQTVPIQIFTGIQFSENFTNETVHSILTQQNSIHGIHFLDEIEKKTVIPEKNKAKTKVQFSNTMILFIILILLLVIAGILFVLNMQTSKKTTVVTLSPTPTQSIPTPTPIPKISVDDATLKIINGSKVVGEATRLKKEFESLGFQSIETDNSEEIVTQTTILYSSRSATIAKEVVEKKLKEYFTNINTMPSDSSQSFDIIITTGKDK